jgi:hypothetical protein
MWKSKKPEEEREPYLTQKDKLAIRPFEKRDPIEARFEPKPTPAREESINIGKSVSIKASSLGRRI